MRGLELVWKSSLRRLLVPCLALPKGDYARLLDRAYYRDRDRYACHNDCNAQVGIGDGTTSPVPVFPNGKAYFSLWQQLSQVDTTELRINVT
jgi:hypothetical protein